MVSLISRENGRIVEKDLYSIDQVNWSEDILAARVIQPILDEYWTLNPNFAPSFNPLRVPVETYPELLVYFKTTEFYFRACGVIDEHRHQTGCSAKSAIKAMEKTIEVRGLSALLDDMFYDEPIILIS